jgi:hypothetical protein
MITPPIRALFRHVSAVALVLAAGISTASADASVVDSALADPATSPRSEQPCGSASIVLTS